MGVRSGLGSVLRTAEEVVSLSEPYARLSREGTDSLSCCHSWCIVLYVRCLVAWSVLEESALQHGKLIGGCVAVWGP